MSEYADDLERGDTFPPVKVMYDGDDYWLYDGFHRLETYRNQGHTTISANVEQGTREKTVWKSLAANQKHGLRRSQADKRRAIKRALKGWGESHSNYEIADHVGVGEATVRRKRQELEDDCVIDAVDKRTGRDGRTIDTSNIGGSSGSSESLRSPRARRDPDQWKIVRPRTNFHRTRTD